MVAAFTTSQSTPDQLETLLRRLLAGPALSAPPPKPPWRLHGSSDIETLLWNLLPGNMALPTRPPPGPIRRDLVTLMCFSCGKAGHSATRCPDLNETFRLCYRDGQLKKWEVVIL